jgi:pimeloyl-ACP methyl ester carboxylesterase
MKLKKVILFGHSFGGSLGIFLAAKYPNLINKLILCAPSYKREVKKSKKLLIRLPQPLRIIFYRIFFPQSDLWRFPRLESSFHKIVNEDLTPYLPEIKAKTLIIWGALDKQTPIKDSYKLKEKIKNSQLSIFPDDGHSLPLKKPALVFDTIKKFL